VTTVSKAGVHEYALLLVEKDSGAKTQRDGWPLHDIAITNIV